MSAQHHITTVETAINIWRNREECNLVLGKKTRCLADVYGLMIYRKSLKIDDIELSEEQREALASAIAPTA